MSGTCLGPPLARAAGGKLQIEHALAVAEQTPNDSWRSATRQEPPLAVNEDAVPHARRHPRWRVGAPSSAEQRRKAQPPQGAALALRLRRQLEAALLRPQADAFQRKRVVEEERDGRGASDVGGGEESDDAREDLRWEVEEKEAGGGSEAQRAAQHVCMCIFGVERRRVSQKAAGTVLGVSSSWTSRVIQSAVRCGAVAHDLTGTYLLRYAEKNSQSLKVLYITAAGRRGRRNTHI